MFCNNRMDKLPEIDCITGYGTVFKKRSLNMYMATENTSFQLPGGWVTEAKPKAACYTDQNLNVILRFCLTAMGEETGNFILFKEEQYWLAENHILNVNLM